MNRKRMEAVSLMSGNTIEIKKQVVDFIMLRSLMEIHKVWVSMHITEEPQYSLSHVMGKKGEQDRNMLTMIDVN